MEVLSDGLGNEPFLCHIARAQFGVAGILKGLQQEQQSEPLEEKAITVGRLWEGSDWVPKSEKDFDDLVRCHDWTGDW